MVLHCRSQNFSYWVKSINNRNVSSLLNFIQAFEWPANCVGCNRRCGLLRRVYDAQLSLLLVQEFLDRSWKTLCGTRSAMGTAWLPCWWSSAWTSSASGGWRKRAFSDCLGRLISSRSYRMRLTVEKSLLLTGKALQLFPTPSSRGRTRCAGLADPQCCKTHGSNR